MPTVLDNALKSKNAVLGIFVTLSRSTMHTSSRILMENGSIAFSGLVTAAVVRNLYPGSQDTHEQLLDRVKANMRRTG
ncbi:hypothetical protein GGS21DRAFT_379539 [Xylaria nigripes]|nr:hypothetical protein GGS21DRAFT_379539 [Xylaria nigripes]